LTHTEVHEFFHYHIIPVSVALQFHQSLSNSEARPRIPACATRPSSHQWRVWSMRLWNNT